MKTANPRKLVIEWRYAPDLRFYGQLDQIGIELQSDFPDWSRSSDLDLKLFNKTTHNSLSASLRRSNLQFHGSLKVNDCLQFASKVHEVLNNRLRFGSLSRLGLRFWHALTFDQAYEQMVGSVQKRFFQSNDAIANILDAKVVDNAYVVDLESEDGWLQHLQFGPASRVEWLQKAAIDKTLFSSKDDELSYQTYVREIPDPALYLDCDFYRADTRTDEFDSLIKQAVEKSSRRAKLLIDYYKNG